MNSCKTLFRASLSSSPLVRLPNPNPSITLVSFRAFSSPSSVLRPNPSAHIIGPPRCALHESASLPVPETLTENPPLDLTVSVKELLTTNRNDVSSMMKMERRRSSFIGGGGDRTRVPWFPYEDRFRCGDDVHLSSREVLEAVSPHMMEERSDRFRRVVENRSFSVCLVVEGLSDIGNISAAFRSADALGIQSVHVVASDSFKRYRNNRHVSMGAEKWLDIELWDTPKDCFKVLKSRGYRIATTHLGMDTVSIYDMDWSQPTAIVVGNEGSGISEEALELSDLYCSIPMNGMVDSFNVSVAAGIVMHHAVCDRTARLGSHGDLSAEEKEILMAEFSLRHSRSSLFIASEFAKRRQQQQQHAASF